TVLSPPGAVRRAQVLLCRCCSHPKLCKPYTLRDGKRGQTEGRDGQQRGRRAAEASSVPRACPGRSGRWILCCTAGTLWRRGVSHPFCNTHHQGVHTPHRRSGGVVLSWRDEHTPCAWWRVAIQAGLGAAKQRKEREICTWVSSSPRPRLGLIPWPCAT